jgi:3-methyl-2-oxobutanoate hydroxymethyltransferase
MSTISEKRMTVLDLKRMKAEGRRIVALTAYDSCFAGLAEQSGVDLLLVGDSVGMTMLGYENTIPVTLEQSLHHTAAVVRGTRNALVIGDMPFLTYHVSIEETLRNAGRYIQEAGAHGVKIEGGESVCPIVEKLVEAGIPVLGHIGILPQSILATGGYRIHGRTPDEAEKLLNDALALERAGAFAIVLEGLPERLAAKITAELTVPTIGIGAGVECDGQVQVVHDLLGLFEKFKPRHARRYAELAQLTRTAMKQYCDDVRNQKFPGKDETFA